MSMIAYTMQNEIIQLFNWFSFKMQATGQRAAMYELQSICIYACACIFDVDMVLNYRVAAFTDICVLRKSLSTVLDLERFAIFPCC